MLEAERGEEGEWVRRYNLAGFVQAALQEAKLRLVPCENSEYTNAVEAPAVGEEAEIIRMSTSQP